MYVAVDAAGSQWLGDTRVAVAGYLVGVRAGKRQ